MKNICLYLHVHQPYRLTKLNYLEIGQVNDYFLGSAPYTNQFFIEKIAQKSYIPTNAILFKLLKQQPEFQFSLSITGVLIEQLQKFAPEVLDSFRKLVDTGRVEILGETYYHSLASIYSVKEFAEQVIAHRNLIKSVFDYETITFRNTELIYNNQVAALAKELGFKAVIAEGWEKFLEWRNSNFVYEATTSKLNKVEKEILRSYRFRKTPVKQLKLLLKNYKLSDDIAFRFSNQAWAEYPLTVKKYIGWLKSTPGNLVNLFMDYETFGEHQWEDTGIFKFLEKLPAAANKAEIGFKTIATAAKSEAVEKISVEDLTSWADLERDLSAWRGNKMQATALERIYNLNQKLEKQLGKLRNKTKREQFWDYWRRLQTSDHFYYMSTKYWSDGDVHKYFSPYDSPYEAFINFMNVLEDFEQRLDYETK